ncbi:uncharacterized protein [Lolium perenne]|uniref:uncharacterized protein n=1 Tax=Lolium perenne TaxID=4522 RepID=UPI0021EB4AB5|nr:uncharacterized protein LOC127314789 [Lolium perenne]XP_051201274.1 uncharacterized protein LOC127314789 [Lolium perenne]XP_051201275.1 uncharacterized protein LOC127314789 [Lolium perenne]
MADLAAEMAGAREAPPRRPQLDLNHPPMDEDAPAGKLSRMEHQRSVCGEPSFRMENLPEEIQPVVMSLLPLKEAVRTSIVARSWRMLWRFHSNLCFYCPDDLDYNSDEYDDTDEQAIDDFIKIKRDNFIEDVNWVIQRHSGIGINKFRIRCGLHKEDFDHLDRWIAFAASSKANVIEFDLKMINYPSKKVYHFPLDALDVQGSSFVQSLFLADVSIKPHSDVRGFSILRRLVLQYVQIFGDLRGLLANCSALEDLSIIECSGVANLSMPHKLDKLQHLLIDKTYVRMVEFHAADLAHFEYKGLEIPIVLHGCSKLEKATIMFKGGKGLGRLFTLVPSILPVKILHVGADILGYEQLQKMTTRSLGMFTCLRHITCQLFVRVRHSELKADNGVLQVAHCLNAAPQLETLHLNMIYLIKYGQMSHQVAVEEEDSPMRRHDHLKTVYMSGFRLYKAQKKLAFSILENASVLEHMQLEPRVKAVADKAAICYMLNDRVERKFVPQVCEWARLASLRFGKVVTAPSE